MKFFLVVGHSGWNINCCAGRNVGRDCINMNAWGLFLTFGYKTEAVTTRRYLCTFSLALNGSGRIFSLPVLTLIFPALLPCIERLSLHWSPNWKIMDWSTGLLMQLTPSSMRNLVSGTWLPWRNVRSGYTMDAWERWRIVCLAALSVEDIEDIYLFGTMITGLLLIGLGFALGYRRIQKTGTRLPVMIEAVGRAVSIETETINRNMDSIKEKLTALQRKIDYIGDQNGQNGQRVAWKIGMCLLAPKTRQSYLFLAPLHSGLGKAVAGIYPGRAMQWDALASSPTLQTLQTLPLPRPLDPVRFEPPACQAGLTSARLVAAGPDGCLLGRIHFPVAMSCVYGVCAFVLLRCFSCSHTVLPKEHSLGVIFFLLPFLMLCCIFFNSTCISLLIILCMIVYVTNNKEPWTLNLIYPPKGAYWGFPQRSNTCKVHNCK